MKKVLLTIALATASLFTLAQSASFGIRGGVNFAKLEASSSFGNSNFSFTSGSLTTYAVGAFADFKFGALSLQPAVSYTGKGGEINLEEAGVAKVKLHYLQIPVNLVYHAPAGIGSVYFGAGPYAGYGLSGQTKVTDGNSSMSEDIKFGDDGDFKRTEFGLNGIAGFQFNTGLLIGVNYDLGLSDISNDNEGSTKNRVLGISVGYKF